MGTCEECEDAWVLTSVSQRLFNHVRAYANQNWGNAEPDEGAMGIGKGSYGKKGKKGYSKKGKKGFHKGKKGFKEGKKGFNKGKKGYGKKSP